MIKIWDEHLLDEMNITLAFRYLWRGGNITVRVAALTAFRVFSDGKLIGYGPRRAAHGVSHINEYVLQETQGTLVIEVASYRCNNYYLPDEPPFFACEVLQDGKIIANSFEFEVFRLDDRIQKVQRYSIQRTFVESYDMVCDRSALYFGKNVIYPRLHCKEVCGNRIEECDLPYPVWDQKSVFKILEHGEIGEESNPFHYADKAITDVSPLQKGYPAEELESFISEEVGRIFCHKSVSQLPETISDGYVLYDMGQNDTGFICLDTEVFCDSEIFLTFDEILWEEAKNNPHISYWFDREELPLCFYRMACCNIIKYKLKSGKYQNLLSFEPYTFRYIKVLVKGKARVNISFIPFVNSDVFVEFKCADQILNKIFEAAINTFRQNAVDILTDCPSRERAGWLCDSYFSGRAERVITGRNRVEKNMLQAFAEAPHLPQLPKGMLPMCYPADHLDGTFIPNWAMFFVLELEEYFIRSGDLALVMSCRRKVEELIEYFEKNFVNKIGLLENLPSWVFVEWSKAAEFTDGINYPSNMLYARMLEAASSLYGKMEFKKRAEEIRSVIRKYSYNGEFFEDNAYLKNGKIVKTGHCTETCQYYAFYFGTADKVLYPELYNTMFTRFGFRRNDKTTYPNVYRSNAFIGIFLRLDYLRKEGCIGQTLDECRDFFGYMAERTGTLWEYSDSQASCNHCFASYVVQFILEGVAGFVSCDPSKKEIYMRKPAYVMPFSCRIPIGNDFLICKDGKIEVPYGFALVEIL